MSLVSTNLRVSHPVDLGCLDLHVNGISVRVGSELDVIDFSSKEITLDRIRAATEELRSRGITHYCPTLTTADLGTYRHALPLLAEAMTQDWGRGIMGISLEGPFFSVDCRGAHSDAIVRAHQKIDLDYIAELVELANEKISWITLSPALDEAPLAISKIRERFGIVVSIGHHSANTEQIISAFNAGATGVTHFGNAWTRELKSAKDISTAVQFAWPGVFKMVIPDNSHVPLHPVVSSLALCNPDQVVFVSDLSPLANAPVGTRRIVFSGLDAVVIEKGDVVVTEPLTGSTLDLVQCRDLAINSGAVSGELAVRATTINPLNFLRPALERMGWVPQ